MRSLFPSCYICCCGASRCFFSARSGILAAALGSLALGLVLAVLAGLPRFSFWNQLTGPWAAVCRVLFWGWGVVLLVRISLICRTEYRSGGLWVLLLAMWLLYLRVDWHALCRMHQAMMGLALLAAFLLAGLLPHIRLANLSPAKITGTQLSSAFMALCCLCPEWLALPFAGEKAAPLCLKLPLLVLFTESSAVFLAEAVFGWQGQTGRFSAMQAVRFCGLGAFSRLDDVCIGLWLVLCLYRLAVLFQLWKGLKKKEDTDGVC